jgi:antitoxin (DNA-binding transcriptional repressor) of toxin-antitoxin stability system
MNTGKLVRASAREKILITDRGQPVALLKSAEAAELIGKPFPKRDIRRMPKVKGDSTTYISEERDTR